MPIIRLAGSGGGFFEGAGQASAAFQNASQEGMRAFQRAQEVEGQALLQAANFQLAQQEQEALFQERQQRAATNKAISDRQNAIRYSGADTAAGKRAGMIAAPFDGGGAFMLFDELAQTNPEAAQAIFDDLAGQFGDLGREVTPEDLEASPLFPMIYSRLSQSVIETRTAAREQAIAQDYEGTVRTLHAEFGDVLSKEEIEAVGAELAVDLADPDLSPAEAAALTKQARSRVAREAGKRKHINGLVQEANDLLVQFPRSNFEGMDSNAWDEAHGLIGDMRTSEDPDDVMARIRLLVDPKAGAIARRVRMDAQTEFEARQAAARVLQEEARRQVGPKKADQILAADSAASQQPAPQLTLNESRRNAAPSRSDLGADMSGYRKSAPSAAEVQGGAGAGAGALSAFPNLSRLLAPEGEQTEADRIAARLRAQGLEPTPENIRRYGPGMIAEERLRGAGGAPTARGAMFQ